MSVLRTHRLSPGEPLIELNHVARRFTKKLERGRSFQDLFVRLFHRGHSPSDEFWPLRDLSLTVNPGDCIGVIGPNGSGKSTLLKIITGILPPTYGDVVVRGRVSSLLELGAGFQPDLTGRENIYLNGSIYGLSRAEMSQRLDRIIDYAGLGDFIDTPVKHYSSGMYVRLGFAVAIHTNPDLLLVDEVLAVGDVHFQNRCMESIYSFRHRGGTLLLVSHDLGTIQSLCNRALWIDDGLVAAEGSPADVVMAYKQHMAELEEQMNGGKQQESMADEQRWGTRELEITHVELCNAEGQARTTFATGEPLTIRLHYRCAEPIEHPVFGFGISHQNGVHLFGPNTKFAALEIKQLHGSGVISYTIPQLPLLEGQYTVSVAAVNETDTLTYDYHDRAYNFRVAYSPLAAGYGMVQLQGEWQWENAAHPLAPQIAANDPTQPHWTKA
jgi:ABC-type polysaccharide/polyol phosphate transport system ATPase subunit